MTSYGKVTGLTTTTNVSTVQTDVNSPRPTFQLWGHTITTGEDGGIKCSHCNKEEELPELFERSGDFREVIYKVYVFGKFKEEECSLDPEDIEDTTKGDGFDHNGDPISNPNSRHRINPNRVHWSGTTTTTSSAQSDTVDMYVPKGQRVMIDGTPYTYHGDGAWVDESDGAGYDTVDLFDKHGKQAEERFLPEIVKEKRAKLQNRKDMMQQQSPDTVGGQLGSIQTDTVTNSSIDAGVTDLSLAENLVSGLQDTTGNFLSR